MSTTRTKTSHSSSGRSNSQKKNRYRFGQLALLASDAIVEFSSRHDSSRAENRDRDPGGRGEITNIILYEKSKLCTDNDIGQRVLTIRSVGLAEYDGRERRLWSGRDLTSKRSTEASGQNDF